MADTDLIHAGLPWNNPQKITVKADQYISQLVINRGLLNLLSNDYYLDLKTERINQYVVDLVGPHINDSSKHLTEDQVVKVIQRFLNGELGTYLDGVGLLGDMAYILPIKQGETFLKSINRIQNIINQCPKNLNGNTLVFALTPVSDDEQYNKNIGQYCAKNGESCYNTPITLLTSYKAISFNNFYGGTLVLMGNNFFVCSTEDAKNGISLNARQTRLLIQQIQKKINEETTPTITIKGNGNNNSCSVVSFNNCNCDSYMWNVNVTIDNSSNDSSEKDKSAGLPTKKELAFFFPANCVNDQLTGNIRYIVADTINAENFNDNYLSLRSMQKNIIANYDTTQSVSSVCLSGDYLELTSGYSDFLQTFFGKYYNGKEERTSDVYKGATLCFWMKDDFYTNNINEVPILYSVDDNGNGFYIGLEKVASIVNNQFDETQYIETSFASKKRDDLNGNWIFWTISIKLNEDKNEYGISIKYADLATKSVNTIVPNRKINANISKEVEYLSLPHLNLTYPVYFFGTPTVRNSGCIRNIMLYNTFLDDGNNENPNTTGLAGEGLEDIYNFSQGDTSKSFNNNMKGALYVYNTYSMNVMGCSLTKILE